jgi:hypothetical protein
LSVESSGAEKSPTNAHYLRRKFKIAGQIGEPGQTDKLTFVSLTHQIDSDVKRKYSEHEIVDAVIRAISLHSSLRSYVETLHDVSLPKLRKILRVHYREKSASELYQQLATIFSNPRKPLSNSFFAPLTCATELVSLARNPTAKFVMTSR